MLITFDRVVQNGSNIGQIEEEIKGLPSLLSETKKNFFGGSCVLPKVSTVRCPDWGSRPGSRV